MLNKAKETEIGKAELKNEGTAKRDYREVLSYLFGLQRFGIKLGLDNINALLKHLGEPHLELRAVHVAGSNGKGSTSAFLTSVLSQAGYRVGLYTSPHLVDFSERIQINGVPILSEEVVSLTQHIRKVAVKMTQEGKLLPIFHSPLLPEDSEPEKTPLTFFEFTTAVAFLYFREKKVDIAVVETGMGGRLDATNVIDPILSLITPISVEHPQYLGKHIMQIAKEKAGIIKPGRPLLTSARQPRVLALLGQRCRELGSPFYRQGKDFSAKELSPQIMNFKGLSHQWRKLFLGLAGSHQVINAALALAAVEFLIESGFTIKGEHVRNGLAQVRWPGRLELIGEHPRILLDGAHNPAATRVLKKALQKGFPRRRLIMVLGIMSDKEIAKMMADLVPLADLLILTRPQMDRAAPLEVLRAQASRYQKPTAEIAAVSQALSHALDEATGDDLILVSGSLFTVGEARAYLASKNMVLS